jgi:hypothetical protein
VFPIDSIMAIMGSGRSAIDLDRASLIVAAQFVAWIVIGMVGLEYTQRSLHRRT